MLKLKTLMAGCLMLGLAACATPDTATRGASVDPSGLTSEAAADPAMIAPDYNVVSIRIDVPRNLKVSEANSFFPLADIVWHGEPLGDRYQQVQAIYEEAFAAGTADLNGARDVVVEATITRFHALTLKARYTTGGMHTLHFVLTVRDAETGEILDGPRNVVADVAGSGGEKALAEEAAGITQKVVIEQRLAQVIRDELTAPVAAADLGEAMLSRQDFSPTDLNIVQ